MCTDIRDKGLQRYFTTARQIERMTSTDSIVKREVQDEKFWFRLTFTTCLWNCPHLVSVARYFFSDLIYAKIWTSSRWVQVLSQFIVSFSSLPSTQLRENWSLVTASRTLCASPESSDRFRDSSFQSCPIILLEFYLLDDIDHQGSSGTDHNFLPNHDCLFSLIPRAQSSLLTIMLWTGAVG